MNLAKLLLLCCLGAAIPCKSAYVVARPGMPPMGVSAPMFPVNSQQCGEFAAAANEYSQKISKWHDDCLKQNPGAAAKDGQCSVSACEGFHRARDSFASQAREEATQCYASVSAVDKEIADSIRSASSIDALQHAILSGPKRLMISKAKEEFASLFSGSARALVKTGVDKTLLMNQTWAGYQRIRNACIRGVPGKDSVACETQALLSLHQFGSSADMASGGNPAFITFRRGLAERRNMIQTDALTKLREKFSEEGSQQEGQSIGL